MGLIGMVAIILLGGCGLKTAPQSDQFDEKPEIPFHKDSVDDEEKAK